MRRIAIALVLFTAASVAAAADLLDGYIRKFVIVAR
jgi:hypothetical protein